MEEHVHILSDLHPSIALADYIREIKASSKINKNTTKEKVFKMKLGDFSKSRV